MNKVLMESYYQTYNSEDPEALRQFYCDDVVLTSVEGTMHGADSILAVYRGLISQFYDQMIPESIEIDGNTAVVGITDKFTAKTAIDDFMGMALAEGDSFELKLKGTYTAVSGKFQNIVIEQRD